MGYFHDGFNPGDQGKGCQWEEVNTKKQKKKGGKAKAKKSIEIRGFKRKMQIDNTIETTQHDNAEYGNETYKEHVRLAGEQGIGAVLHKETTARIVINMGLPLTKFMAK
eukprot:8138503-Ditylum_brightwellii.AAC.1